MVQRKHRRTSPRTLGQASLIPDSVVQAIAVAIARAEGFFAGPHALPVRANNPGNLKLGDLGRGTIDGKTIFKTIEDGWAALYRQIRLMLTGASKYYTPEMTIAQVAEIYTGADNALAWAKNVAVSLGVSIQTKLSDLFSFTAGGPGSTPEMPPPGGTGPGPETVALLIVGFVLLLWAVS